MQSEINSRQVDLLLVYPPWTVLTSRGILTNALPPLGILTIAAHAERHGYNVKVIDIHAERMSPDDFYEMVKEYNPRFVGITVLSSMIAVTHALAKEVKDLNADCKVIVGGVHAELFPEEMLSNPSIDYVVRGDGEEPILALLDGERDEDILGISYRNSADTDIVVNLPQ